MNQISRSAFPAKCAAVGQSCGCQGDQRSYSDIDLLAVWGDWVLLFATKFPGDEIVPGELAFVYRSALQMFETDGLFPKRFTSNGLTLARLCLIYLTPTEQTGIEEFDSFEVAAFRDDAKVKLTWESILTGVFHAFPDDRDALGRIIRDSGVITRRIVAGIYFAPSTIE